MIFQYDHLSAALVHCEKLKRLGVMPKACDQTMLWVHCEDDPALVCVWPQGCGEGWMHKKYLFPAWTMPNLIGELKRQIWDGEPYGLNIAAANRTDWSACYYSFEKKEKHPRIPVLIGATPENAAAMLLIWCIRHGYIQICKHENIGWKMPNDPDGMEYTYQTCPDCCTTVSNPKYAN